MKRIKARVEFGRLKSLKKLVMANNKLKEMAFLNGHGKIHHVDLSENFICRIPDLYGLVSLAELVLM